MYPQFLGQARSRAHQKFLYENKSMNDAQLFKQYQNKVKNREQSQQYFVIQNDGSMISKPYLQEQLNYGIDKKVFDIQASEYNQTSKVGDQIAMSLGVTKSNLHEATVASDHVKQLKGMSLQQQIDHDQNLYEKTQHQNFSGEFQDLK